MIKVIPDYVKLALGLLAVLVLLLGVASLLAAVRGRQLARQRRRLLGEVGLLQEALLPPVPDLDGLVASAAYRPAEGIAAGGDFYDVFGCPDGRVGVLIGDLSGHGRDALSRTALVRHTVRAYLEAGLEPRSALQLAGRVLERAFTDEEFATILVASYDPNAGTLTHAAAGHPPPIVLAPGARAPVTVASAPAVALGQPTGQRQTRMELPAGAVILFYTDGLLDARSDERLLGQDGLTRMLSECDSDATAATVLERVLAQADRAPDDMAACMLRVTGDNPAAGRHVEELEASLVDFDGKRAERFLRACGVSGHALQNALRSGSSLAKHSGSALLQVDLRDSVPSVSVVGGNVVSIGERSRLGATKSGVVR